MKTEVPTFFYAGPHDGLEIDLDWRVTQSTQAMGTYVLSVPWTARFRRRTFVPLNYSVLPPKIQTKA